MILVGLKTRLIEYMKLELIPSDHQLQQNKEREERTQEDRR